MRRSPQHMHVILITRQPTTCQQLMARPDAYFAATRAHNAMLQRSYLEAVMEDPPRGCTCYGIETQHSKLLAYCGVTYECTHGAKVALLTEEANTDAHHGMSYHDPMRQNHMQPPHHLIHPVQGESMRCTAPLWLHSQSQQLAMRQQQCLTQRR